MARNPHHGQIRWYCQLAAYTFFFDVIVRYTGPGMLDTRKHCVRDCPTSNEFIVSPGQIATELALDPKSCPDIFAWL